MDAATRWAAFFAARVGVEEGTVNIDPQKILDVLGSAGSQTTAASLALMLFFYLRRQEKEVRKEYLETIKRLQAERAALLAEIRDLQKELDDREEDLDRERKARRDAEDDAHARGLRVVDGGVGNGTAAV